MLKYNITTNKVAKFRILYTFEDFELKYTLKMTEFVGSTNILYRFMNTSVRYVRYKVISSKCKRPYLCKKRIVLSSSMSKTPGYDLGQLSSTR